MTSLKVLAGRLALFAGISLPCHAQAVFVVDAAAGPGFDAVSIQAGVALAANGDVLLVRAGTYSESVSIVGKGVTIVADLGADVSVRRIAVDALPAGSFVTLRGIDIDLSVFNGDESLELTNCLGAIHVEDCRIAASPLPAGRAMRIDRCEAVAIARCTIEPIVAPIDLSTLTISRSKVALIESTIEGGDGAASFIGPTQSTRAIEVVDASVTISACSVRGGNGGSGATPAGCANGSDGSPALVLMGSGLSAVEIIDSVVTGGLGGPAPVPCSPGATSAATVVQAGTLVGPPAVAPRFEIGTPLRSGEDWTFEFSALPGSLTWFVLGLAPGSILPVDPLLAGVVTVGAPRLLIPFVTMPTSGILDETVFPQTFHLPPGFAYLSLYLQPLASEPTFGLVAGTPSLLLVIDAAL